MDWLLLGLISAFTLASADAAQKHYLSHYTGLELMVIRFGVAGLLLLPFALVNEAPPSDAAFWLWMLFLVPMEFFAMWLYVSAVRDSPLHLTVPYLAFTPVFNVVTAYLVLGEEVSAFGLLGVLLVVMGAYLLNLKRGRDAIIAPFLAIIKEQGSRRMLVASIVYSITSVGSKAAMLYTTPWVFGPLYFVVIGFVLLGSVAILKPSTLVVLKKNHFKHLLIGGLMAAMVVTHFLAIAKVEVAYFITVKRTSLLFGILYGALFFGEKQLAKNLLAGGFMTAGVMLVVQYG